MSGDTVERLRRRLSVLAPTQLDIVDESHLHAGHVGAQSGGGHYRVHITAAAFAGQRSLARHRLVLDAAGDLMHGPIHALSIVAAAPGEV